VLLLIVPPLTSKPFVLLADEVLFVSVGRDVTSVLMLEALLLNRLLLMTGAELPAAVDSR